MRRRREDSKRRVWIERRGVRTGACGDVTRAGAWDVVARTVRDEAVDRETGRSDGGVCKPHESRGVGRRREETGVWIERKSVRTGACGVLARAGAWEKRESKSVGRRRRGTGF